MRSCGSSDLLRSPALAGIRGARGRTSWHRGEHSLGLYQTAVAATFLAVIDSASVRGPVRAVVAPLTAAIAPACSCGTHEPGGMNHACRAIALALLVVTAATTISYNPERLLLSPRAPPHAVKAAYSQLLASPPFEPPARSRSTRPPCGTTPTGQDRVIERYVRPASRRRSGDGHGSTRSNRYLLERPIAGGQLFWHHGWRSDTPRTAVPRAAAKRRYRLPCRRTTRCSATSNGIREFASTWSKLRGTRGALGRLLIDNGGTRPAPSVPLAFRVFGRPYETLSAPRRPAFPICAGSRRGSNAGTAPRKRKAAAATALGDVLVLDHRGRANLDNSRRPWRCSRRDARGAERSHGSTTTRRPPGFRTRCTSESVPRGLRAATEDDCSPPVRSQRRVTPRGRRAFDSRQRNRFRWTAAPIGATDRRRSRA